MIKPLLKISTSLLLITSILLPQLALAQIGAMNAGASLAMQELTRQRKEKASDTAPCEPTKPGFGLDPKNFMKLQNLLSQGIQQKLSETLTKTLENSLNQIVEQQLGQNLPRLIEEGLSQQLPNLLRQKLNGVPEAQRDSEGPRLLRESVQELLPGIIQGGLPSLLQDGVSRGLSQDLNKQFQAQAPDILRNSEIFMQSFTNMIAESTNMINLVLSGDINGVLEGVVGNITSIIDDIVGNLADSFENGQELNSGDVNGLQNRLLGQIDLSNKEGIAQGQGVDQMVQKMMPVIMKGLMNGTGSSFGGLAGRISGNGSTDFFSKIFSNAGVNSGFSDTNSFDFKAWAGNNVTAAIGFDLAPVSQAIAHPLALATVSGLGVSGYDSSVGRLAAFGYQGEPTVGALRWADGLSDNGADYAYRLGYNGPMTDEALRALNSGTFGDGSDYLGYPGYADLNPSGPGGIADAIGTDATSNFNADSIVDGATTGMGAQIGNSLKGGLVNGLSGGIGNLVDGIPYVGGLLSPIAEDLVQTALNALIGTNIMTDWPVSDRGLQQTVGDGFKNTIKTLSKPLNKSEQHLDQVNKQLDADRKVQLDHQAVLIKECLQEKAAKENLERLTDAKYVLDQAAQSNKLILLGRAQKNFVTFDKEAVPDRLDPNGQARSTISDLPRNINEARTEGTRTAIAQASQSGNPRTAEIAKDVQRITEAPASAYQESLTVEQQNKMANEPLLIPSGQFMNDFPKMFNPANDQRGIWSTLVGKAMEMATSKEFEEIVKHIANRGTNDIVECMKWEDVQGNNSLGLDFTSPSGAPLPGGTSTGAKVCTEWKVIASGATIAARKDALAIADISATTAGQGYKQDSTGPLGAQTEQFVTGQYTGQAGDLEYPCPGLGPCNVANQYTQSGYTASSSNPSLVNDFGFDSAFSGALSEVFANSASGLSNQITGWSNEQINSFTSRMTSSLDNAGFAEEDFQVGNEFGTQTRINTLVLGNLNGLPNIGDEIIKLIVQAIIDLINQTP